MTKTKATGTVTGNPIIVRIAGGVLVGNIFIDIPDVGRAKVFYDDPESEHMFSFADGDEVNVEWWKKGEWLNATIKTPKGSADAAEAVDAALHKQSGGSVSDDEDATVLDDLADLLYLCRQAVIDAEIHELIHSDVSPDAKEETIRTATISIFIEANKSGVDIGKLLGL